MRQLSVLLILLALLVAAQAPAQDEPNEPPRSIGKLPGIRARPPNPLGPRVRDPKRSDDDDDDEGSAARPGRVRPGRSARGVQAEASEDSAAAREEAAKAGARARDRRKGATGDDPAESDDSAGKDAKVKAKAATDIDSEERFRRGKGYFNFEKAELIDVVKQISKLTKKNFIVPERLKSQKITIICEHPVSTDDAYRAFLAALEINSLNLVPSGQFFKIEQRKDSVRQPVPTLLEGEVIPENEQLITAILELEHVDVDSVKKVVQNLMSKDGTLEPLGGSMMILSDSGANILRIKKILKKIDIEGSTNQIHIVDIQFSAASDVAKTLGQLFEAPKGKKGSTPMITRRPSTGSPPDAEAADANAEEGEDEQVVLAKSIADDRTNKLILICSRRSFERIKEIIEILDVPVEEGVPQVHVYFLGNAVAEEISRTISTLAQGSTAKNTKGKKPGTDAADLFEGQVKITADKATNSLVIVATGRDYKRLIKVIERLDVRRPQVFVEAVIMEVSLETTIKLGLNLYSGYQLNVPGLGTGYGMMSNPGGQQLVQGAGTSAAESAISSALGTSSAATANLSSLAAFLGFLSFRGPAIPGTEELVPGGLPSVGAVLEAIKSDSDVDVLSTPHILTTDNEKAEILVGENIPFAGSFMQGGSSYGGFLGPQVSVQRQDVALKFAVTPHVSDDRQVRLEIEQEVSDVSREIPVGTFTQPVTTKKNAKTTVVVRDQQTIILGGLINKKKSQSEEKIPLLGDLPIIGWAFKWRKTNDRKSNLLLVLTPYIIESDEDFRRIYERKMLERKEFIEYFYGDSEEFTAPVEYAKKAGPFGALHAHVAREMLRVENGGPGLGDEILVTPPSEATIDIAPPVVSEPSGDEGGQSSTGQDARPVPAPSMPAVPRPVAPPRGGS